MKDLQNLKKLEKLLKCQFKITIIGFYAFEYTYVANTNLLPVMIKRSINFFIL